MLSLLNQFDELFEGNKAVASQLRQVYHSVAFLQSSRSLQTTPDSERPANALSIFTKHNSSASSLFLLVFSFRSFAILHAHCTYYPRAVLHLLLQQLFKDVPSTMRLYSKLSALWLAACAIAGPPDKAVTNVDGIRSIPVCQARLNGEGIVLIESL